MKKRFFILLALIVITSCTLASSARHAVDSIARIIEDNYLSQGKLTRELVIRLYQIAGENKNDKSLLAQAIYWDTLTEYSHRSNEPDLILRIDSLLHTEGAITKEYDMALLTYSRSLANMAHGNYMEAFHDALAAYNMVELLQDKKLIIRTLMTLGNVSPYSQNYDLSAHYYDRVAQLISIGDPDYYRLCINRTRLEYIKRNYETAISDLSTILPDIDQSGDRALPVVARINLGSYYTGMEQRDKAINYYLEALELMENIDNNNYLLDIIFNKIIYG